MNTRLILIEGLPGSGKTSTAAHLGQSLRGLGFSCRWYLEEDPDHPIDCVALKLKNLHQKLPPLWQAFMEQALQESTVNIIESRLWQNTALFMLMAEYPLDEIMLLHQQVCQMLKPLSPVLLYLYQTDVESAQRRIYKARGQAWMEGEMESLSKYPWFRARGLDGFAGWLQFFQEWALVAEQLFEDWPHRKIKIDDPHQDWGRAYREMQCFLELVHLP